MGTYIQSLTADEQDRRTNLRIEALVEVINVKVELEMSEGPWSGALIYLIELHPDGRFKVGCASHWNALEARVKAAKTWVPEARLVKAWRAEWKWERQVRHVLGSTKPVPLSVAEFPHVKSPSAAGSEVLVDSDKETLISRADELFGTYLHPLLPPMTEAEKRQHETDLERLLEEEDAKIERLRREEAEENEREAREAAARRLLEEEEDRMVEEDERRRHEGD